MKAQVVLGMRQNASCIATRTTSSNIVNMLGMVVAKSLLVGIKERCQCDTPKYHHIQPLATAQ